MGGRAMGWIDLAHDGDMWRALVNAEMKHRFPLKRGNFLTSCEPISFSGRTLIHGFNELAIKLVKTFGMRSAYLSNLYAMNTDSNHSSNKNSSRRLIYD